MIRVRSSGAESKASNDRCDRLRRKSIAFLANLFKLGRRNNCLTGMRIDEETTATRMQRSPRFESPACGGGTSSGCRPRSGGPQEPGTEDPFHASVSRIPSTLSVAAVEAVVACRRASPSHSILTLTPGRTRNIDQDMEALRLSRQDNPFLQVLASKESLIESAEESESDDAILMSQEFGDTDPLTLAQVHEHLVRSPPPASWSRSPTFSFPQQSQSRQDCGGLSPNATLLHRTLEDQPKNEDSMEIRDRHTHTFSLLDPTPIRSLSEVRRLHRSADDSVQLMSSE
ncbi:PREDICTED: uncharacterized protein LOC105368915 [Ceratosolen solmsi marchali]|uniref:Uncharacterized protein LOC105368915 n=1 Tax=Ceratosolen solmsi marchali TaxID=326594 RepID=A0AAJ6YXU3_9HYME|nr:PREDICTED: uncharacterized protein LOC105368915 [Ceratosolen solmsi marchali]